MGLAELTQGEEGARYVFMPGQSSARLSRLEYNSR
jgi:hypothetical protein